MADEKRGSRRKFVKRAALGGTALAGGGLAWSFFRSTPGPDYPATWINGMEPLRDFVTERPNVVLINANDLGWGELSCRHPGGGGLFFETIWNGFWRVRAAVSAGAWDDPAALAEN